MIKTKQKFFLTLLIFLIASLSLNVHAAKTVDSCQNNTVFNVGAGIYDITGPAAETGMMGYGMINQKTAGIDQRLWARAFIIESPCNGKSVVVVSADLAILPQGVKQQVILKLKERYGNRFMDDNVLLSATHQHSGPGGYSTYALYNLTILGFSRSNFNSIVDGITNAIQLAQLNMQSARIKIATGNLQGFNFNRSPAAYLLNPKQERDHYQANTDTEMTLLRFETLNGKPIGMINWFPVHGVSMNNKNHEINGDNKGYAAYLFEKDFNSQYGAHDFVAAFAQANAGDASPNEYGHEGSSGLAGLNAVEKSGRGQYEKAKDLFEHASEVLTGGIDYRHSFVEMDTVKILPTYANGNIQKTCPAAIGISMLAGTQDGEGLGEQGVTCESIQHVIPRLICKASQTACQGVKPIALETGTMTPYPWTPNILPFQVMKIGQLVIAAAPFEMTTMAGRRLHDTIAQNLSSGTIHPIVIATLANAYAQYVTTHEEYQLQRYEGASTLFGPWQLNAMQQIFADLTKALAKGDFIPSGPIPLDLSGFQITLQTGVLFDDKPIGKSFGDVEKDVHSSYKPGDTVEVSFWGAHPKNNFHNQDSFLEVQRWQNGEWQTIRKDWDWDTEFHWQRKDLAYSLVTIVWRIPKDEPKGLFRILYRGDYKYFWNGRIYPFANYSSPFSVSE